MSNDTQYKQDLEQAKANTQVKRACVFLILTPVLIDLCAVTGLELAPFTVVHCVQMNYQKVNITSQYTGQPRMAAALQPQGLLTRLDRSVPGCPLRFYLRFASIAETSNASYTCRYAAELQRQLYFPSAIYATQPFMLPDAAAIASGL